MELGALDAARARRATGAPRSRRAVVAWPELPTAPAPCSHGRGGRDVRCAAAGLRPRGAAERARSASRRCRPAPPDADIETRLALVRRSCACARRRASTVDGNAVRRIRAESAPTALGVRRAAGASASVRRRDAHASAGILLAFAYPDRIGQLRAPRSGRFLLRNGNGAALAGAQSLSDSAFVVAAELDGRRPESRIFLAARVDLEELERHFARPDHAASGRSFGMRARAPSSRASGSDSARSCWPNVRCASRTRTRWRAFCSTESARPAWTRCRGATARDRCDERLAFLHRVDASWPDVSDAALRETLGDLARSPLYGARGR